MKTIESQLIGKQQCQDLCEDGIYISKQITAVIDGATAKSDTLIDGKSSGRFAKDAVIGYLSEHEDDICELPACLMYEALNEHLRACAEKYQLQYNDYPRACVAVYNEKRHELSVYGDCQCILNGKLYKFDKKIDRINADFRALSLEIELSSGKSVEDLMLHDTGRERILPSLRRQVIFENQDNEYGYPVLNGSTFNKDMVFQINVEKNSEIVLATDGYPFLENTLEKSERKLSMLLEEDPLCIRQYKSTKGLVKNNNSYDDRAYWKGVAE